MPTQTITADTEGELYKEAAKRIAADIRGVLARKGNCMIGLVGGHTEGGLLHHLVPLMEGIKGRIDVFWLDERVQGEKNYLPAIRYMERMRGKMLEIYWHPLKGTDPNTAVKEANRTLEHITKLRGKPELDVIILSSGEDCHIASLFPKSHALDEKKPTYLLVEHAPKAPSLRVSASPGLLLTAKYGFLFFVGDKMLAYSHFLDPRKKVRECPEKLLLGLPNLTVCARLG